MRHKATPRSAWLLLGLCGALLLAVPLVLAQADGGYDLSWWTVDGGGGTLIGSVSPVAYTLGGTIGQADADVLEGGGYILTGGFWSGVSGSTPGYEVYLPLVMRSPP